VEQIQRGLLRSAGEGEARAHPLRELQGEAKAGVVALAEMHEQDAAERHRAREVDPTRSGKALRCARARRPDLLVTSIPGLESDFAPGSLFVLLLIALAAALVGGTLALWLRQSVIVGFLLAGLALGPFTPGLVGPSGAIAAVAEVGVIFLLFAVGVQLSLRDLLGVGRVAIGGGLLQVGLTIAAAAALGRLLGLGAVESFAFGAVISNSSSTVISRVLLERGELETGHARLAIAWSSVQDVSTVLLVAVFAMLAPGGGDGAELVSVAKGAAFLFLLVPAALWLLPWLFRHAAVSGIREIFILLVVTVALGMAYAASLLGVSVALGAFFAGVAVGESPTAHRILGDAIPLRDIFSGVFFVSIGMSVDPAFVVQYWPLVGVTVLLTTAFKGLLSAGLAYALGCTPRVALLVGAALAQSAEFSFLLAQIGRQSGLLGEAVFGSLLGGAALSIVLAPAIMHAAAALAPRAQRLLGARPERESPPASAPLVGHAIVCGYGRVGSVVTDLLARLGAPAIVIEEDAGLVAALRARGAHALFGDAAQGHVLDRAGLAQARLLVICIPERMAARRVLDHVQAVNPQAVVLARAHSERERRELYRRGVQEVVLGELELALELSRRSGQVLGFEAAQVESAIEARRRDDQAESG
jgi:CPA2 family monovalent cation:H+ antiporter-2